MCFKIFYNKKTRSYAIKTLSSKSPTSDIFPKGSSMVLVENWPLLIFLVLGNKGQKNVFYDIIERKNAFLRYKNMKLKKSKNWHFSKRVGPWFRSKIGHFLSFFS